MNPVALIVSLVLGTLGISIIGYFLATAAMRLSFIYTATGAILLTAGAAFLIGQSYASPDDTELSRILVLIPLIIYAAIFWCLLAAKAIQFILGQRPR